jgi:O-antigen ligase
MDIAIVAALIVAIPSIITALVALAALIIAFKTSRQIHDVHLSLNSRFDEWMKSVKTASFAEGRKAEQDSK